MNEYDWVYFETDTEQLYQETSVPQDVLDLLEIPQQLRQQGE